MTNKRFSRADIDSLPQRYRANLINSVSGFKSANLVGTRSANGQDNLAIFSSVVHLGANPPLLGMVMRPHSVRRDTLENLQETSFYTINHVTDAIKAQAHQTSARYEQQDSEFSATGLQIETLNDFNAPFVMASPIKLAMKHIETVSITHNDTLFVIGEIMQIHIDDALIEDDGYVNLEQAGVVCVNGLDGYAMPTETVRYEYAKPDQPAREKRHTDEHHAEARQA